MSPIDQVNPTQPANWTRRPENRNKRGGQPPGKDKDSQDKNHSGHRPGETPGGREHIVDELA